MPPPSPRSTPPPPRDAPVTEADPVLSEVPCDAALEARLSTHVRCPSVRAALRARRRADFSSVGARVVLAATLNAGGAPPPADGADLAPWLAPRPVGRAVEAGDDGDGGSAGAAADDDDDTLAPLAPLPDLVAVSLQEIVTLSPAAVVAGGAGVGAAGAAVVAAWEGAISAALATIVADAAADGRADPATTYARVPGAAATLVGLHVALWARQDVLPSISCVDATTVAAGGALGGRLGNKGAAAVRCLLADTPLTFVGVHLPSGGAAGDAARRDAAVKDALLRGVFDSPTTSTAPAWAGRPRLSAALADADVAFFFGDLNYRLLARDDAVRRALAAGDADKLALLDELAGPAAAARGSPLARAPGGWREGRLAFAPTYKKVAGTGGSVYVGDDASDTAADPAAARTPAWTDRVLWREKVALDGGGAAAAAAAAGVPLPGGDSPPPRRAALLWYDAAPAVDASDHTPVAAAFEVAVRTIDGEALAAAIDAARRAVDAAEQAAVPRLSVTPKDIDFGTLERGDVARGALVVTNAGGVPLAWAFAPVEGQLFADGGPKGPRAAPVWAALHPPDGALAPGESACVQIVVSAGAGPRGAADAAARRGGALDAILIARADGGNDEFVAVTGRVRPSCLGLAPSTLAGVARPLVPDDGWGADLPPAPAAAASPVRTVSGLQAAAAAAASLPPPGTATATTLPPPSLPPVRTASGVAGAADPAAPPSAAPPSAASSGDAFYSPASSLASAASTPGPASSTGRASPFGGGEAPLSKPPSPQRSRFAPAEPPPEPEPEPAPPPPPPPPPPPLHGLPPPSPEDEAVPPELRALTAFLTGAAAATPALFAHAADRARRAAAAAAGGGWADVGVDSLLKGLDRGRPIDDDTHPADAAAALLTLLACLPAPLVPRAASAPTARGIVPPPAALGDALRAALPRAEWATLRHVARALKKIASNDATTTPDATAAVAALAASVADFVLGEPDAPARVSAAGTAVAAVGADAVAGLQAAADAADAVEAARAALAARVIEFAPIW